MKRFYPYIAGVIAAFLILIYFLYPYLKPLDINRDFNNYKETSDSNEVKVFIKDKLSREDGAIYTNYLDKENNGDETRGHDILSESQGLIMEYALMTNNQELFSSAYDIVKKYMILDNGLISWRISKQNEKNKTSALIDELRIARCLIDAYLKFDVFKYKVDAIKLSTAMIKHSTYDEMVTDFNDGNNTSKILTLCYIDLDAFKLLSSIDEKWKDIYTYGEDIINKGFISNDIPLYKKSYNLENKTYSNEKENELLYSLMVWENLIKLGKDPEPINKWMKEQLQKYGCLYTKYSTENSTPATYIESTSIYAVALRISLEGNDKNLQDKLYKSLMKYKVDNGELKGSFGMEKLKEAYSFDNIESMIAFLQKDNSTNTK